MSPPAPFLPSPLMREKRSDHMQIDFSYGAFEDSRPSTPETPSSTSSRSPLLGSWDRSPPSSPFTPPIPRAPRAPRRRAPRSSRILWLVVVSLLTLVVLLAGRERSVVARARQRARKLAQRVREERCRYMPSLAHCPDPFGGLFYEADAGELLYPAVPVTSSASPALSAQPHPIHHLIREAEAAWQAKVARQSTTLAEAVAEYKRRYNQAPPRGFDAWFAFAQENGVQLLDEYDSIHSRLQPYAALRPEVLRERSSILQNTSQWGGEELWMHQHTVTISVEDEGRKIEAKGPMRHANHRSDQVMSLLDGIAQFLPDLNITITGHDVPWIVISGEHKQMHVAAAEKGEYIDDLETFQENWELDGWQYACLPDSPIRKAGSFLNRLEWEQPEKTSLIGLDHVKAMDVCSHPENQALHGYTAWTGPRPGLLFPLFSFSATSVNSDLLLPPLEQYERGTGPDPVWADKQHDKALWRGSTTGADLTAAHARKYSQRLRLARLPAATGTVTLPLASQDRNGVPRPVEEITASASDLAAEFLDVQFTGFPAQCGDAKTCEEIEREFQWDGYMPEEEQNQYKYVIDVDGNGWSGRFHRLMSTNSLVLKSTVFPEWYADRIQPWVHYVPLKTDYTDLYPILAFFKGVDGRGGHDELAEKIASAGKQWAEENWRWVDMQAYLFRLLLEYARIMNRDDPLQSQDFVLPASGEPGAAAFATQ
ncbi:Protein O-glucosyltransferase 2 [Rhodotorula kratochvilovae]